MRNRRVKMTKKMLKEALIELLEEKTIEQISIRELADHADINRSTFYSHYETIYDLLDEIIQEYMSKIEFVDKDHKFGYDSVMKTLSNILKDKEIYLVLLKTGKYEQFMIQKSLHMIETNQLEHRFIFKDMIEEYKLMTYYTCIGSVRVLENYLNGNIIMDIEDVAKYIYLLEEESYKLLLKCKKK